MSQYDCKIVYIKGNDNCVADALSCTAFDLDLETSIPYPLDNCKPVAVIAGAAANCFKCAQVMTDPLTAPTENPIVAPTLSILMDTELLESIRTGYTDDPWTTRLLEAVFLPHGVQKEEGLLYTEIDKSSPGTLPCMNCFSTSLMMF